MIFQFDITLKRYYAIVLLAFFCFAAAATAQTWQQIPIPATMRPITQIEAFSPAKAWAVNNRNEVWKTNDAGQTWERTDWSFTQISLINTTTAWAINAKGQVFRTGNEGQNWGQTTITLAQVSAVNLRDAWGVNAQGEVLRTLDGGATWAKLGQDMRQVSAADAETAWAIDALDQIWLRTKDAAGSKWRRVTGKLKQIKAYDANSAYGVNAAGEVLRTNDAGATWQQLPGALTHISVARHAPVWAWGTSYGDGFRYLGRPGPAMLSVAAGEANKLAPGGNVAAWQPSQATAAAAPARPSAPNPATPNPVTPDRVARALSDNPPQSASNETELGFDPFAQPATSQPAEGGNAGQQASALPPWRGGAQAAAPGTASADPPSDPPPDPSDVIALYEGIYTQRNFNRKKTGDGITAPYGWATPVLARVERAGADRIVVRFTDNQTMFPALIKQSDTVFVKQPGAVGQSSITFRKEGKGYVFSWGGKEYVEATTAERGLSKDRFNPDVLAKRENRRSLYALEALIREWNSNLMGFDGLNMDLFSRLPGRKAQIFESPGDYEHAVDDEMGLSLPYGLRGERTRGSGTAQTEALITNSAAFQRTISFNFGGGASAGSASLGSKFSYENTKGVRTRAQTLRAIGLTTAERYVLLLDQPNQQLSASFRADIEALADGRKQAAQIVGDYGTHYANAIAYGGIAKAEKNMDSNEIVNVISSRIDAGASGGFKGANLEGGFGYARSSSKGNESMFTQDDFKAIGGNGAWEQNQWTVTDNDTVPIRYDLRPLSELISPIFFPAGGNAETEVRYRRARSALETEIQRYMRAGTPPLNDRYAPNIYEVEVRSLRCLTNGDEGNSAAKLYGRILLQWQVQPDVQPNIELFSASEGAPATVGCAVQELPLNKRQRVISWPQQGQRGSNGVYWIYADGLHEDDNSVFDKDDPLGGASSYGRPFSAVADKGWQYESFTDNRGPRAGGPVIDIMYQVRTLK